MQVAKLTAFYVSIGLICGTFIVRGQVPTTAPASQPAPSGPMVDKLTLHPSPITPPTMRYKMLMDAADQTPGNGAMLYLVAVTLGPEVKTATPDLWDKATDYLDVPLAQLPQKDVEKALEPFADTLRYAELAASRQEARWDPPVLEFGLRAMMPYLNDMKVLTNLMNVQGYLQVARKDWTAAARTQRSALSMARQLNDRALFIQGIIEAGMADAVLNRITEAWIEQGDSPNLYWPLSRLPSPFVDLRPIAAWDEFLHLGFPELDQALKDQLPPERWPQVIEQIVQVGRMWQSPPDTRPSQPRAARQLVESNYPRAKEFLITSGMGKEQVEAMSPEQVVGRYLIDQYRSLVDKNWQGWELPYWQAAGYMHRTEEETNRERRTTDNPLLNAWSPIAHARDALARVDRHIAMLRTIEALRDYAGRHDGHLPQSLDQITDLPLPIDPFTGRPFAYRVEGQKVVLDAPVPPDQHRDNRRGWRYELTFTP